MEIMRRTFIKRLLSGASIIVTGTWPLLKKIAPRKSWWALKTKKYPGKIKKLEKIEENSIWSG